MAGSLGGWPSSGGAPAGFPLHEGHAEWMAGALGDDTTYGRGASDNDQSEAFHAQMGTAPPGTRTQTATRTPQGDKQTDGADDGRPGFP